MGMKDESKLKLQQIKTSNVYASVTQEIEALSNSFQENKATVAQLWSQLQMNEQLPDQLLDSLPWTIQIVQKLECRLYRKLNTRSS